MPKILFKYRDYTNEYNWKTLFDFEIYLASTATFNDPYEASKDAHAIAILTEWEGLKPTKNKNKKLSRLLEQMATLASCLRRDRSGEIAMTRSHNQIIVEPK